MKVLAYITKIGGAIVSVVEQFLKLYPEITKVLFAIVSITPTQKDNDIVQGLDQWVEEDFEPFFKKLKETLDVFGV